MMFCKLSFITMVCWIFVCKSALIWADESHHQKRPPHYYNDDIKQVENFNNHFKDSLSSAEKPNLHSENDQIKDKRKFIRNKREDDSLIITTKQGKVRGLTVTAATGKTVDTWLGIPYAKKPLDKLRFRKPEPLEMWNDEDPNFIYNATKLPNSCVQIYDTFFGNFSGAMMWNPNSPLSEDCLYLSITVPRPRPRNAAVLIWIFGGGFYSGTSTLEVYDRKILSSEENVILVSIQYRVTSLGFLYLGTDEAPGNVGLFDQQMGLQWVHDNIAAFGGNPSNITLFGESAGAVSVSLHLLSPLTRNLFSQAIMESGSPTAPWAIVSHGEAIRRGFRLAKFHNCSEGNYLEEDVQSVVECLRNVNAQALVNSEWIAEKGACDFPFVPIVDGEFLQCHPKECIRNKDFKNTNIIVGSNSEEGFYFIMYYLTDMFKKEENITISRKDFEQAVAMLYPEMNDIVRQTIIFEYTDWLNPDDPIKNRDALDKIVGDREFTCNVNEFAHAYAEAGNNVYMYYFKHRSSHNVWPSWIGVMHGDEINYIFGEPLNPKKNYKSQEVQLSKKMMKFWANFAKTGNPNRNVDRTSTRVTWHPYTVQGQEYLTFDNNTSTTYGKGPRIRPCIFWKQYIPQLLETADNITRNCRNTANISYVRGISFFHFVTIYFIIIYTTGWSNLLPLS